VQLAVFPKVRNHFAHGGGYRLGMPNESARAIHDLAEIINRLWGARTSGGRIYPASLERSPVVLAWSREWPTQQAGAEFTVLRPEQVTVDAGEEWTYLVVLAAGRDHELSEFDARYEVTSYPTDLLWGPGTREQAIEWLADAAPGGDKVQYLDRLFAIRRGVGKVDLPCRPEILAAAPEEFRAGHWHLVRADFPMDAYAHIGHTERGEPCPDSGFGGCPVEDVAAGSWAEVANAAAKQTPDWSPTKYSEVRVPGSGASQYEVGG
jgi:hypothetical protein